MKKFFYLSVLLATLVLTSCASTISTTVQRPAVLNLHGANSISVLPFQTSAYGDDGAISILGFFRAIFDDDYDDKRRICNQITNELTSSLLDTGFMDVVGAKRVQTALENGSKIPCDVYLTGYISDYKESLEKDWSDDDECWYYKKNLKLRIVYEVIDTKSNYVIQRKSRSYDKTSSKERNSRNLPSSFSMVESDLNYLVRQIMKELQPYEETKYLKLIDDKDKSEEMKAAKQLAKDGNLEKSLSSYKKIYNSTGLFEAGYNAGIILEAQGKLNDAEDLMQQLYETTGERKALTALNDIQEEKASAKKLFDQLSEKEGR